MAKKKDDILDDMLSTKTPEAAIKDIDVKDVFGEDTEIAEESTSEEEVEHEVLPYFSIVTNLPQPEKGEELGKEVDITIHEFQHKGWVNPEHENWGEKHFLKITLDGVKYSWGASSAQTKSILSAGLEANMLPDVKAKIRIWKGKNSAQPSINVKIKGAFPKPRMTVEELLAEYSSGTGEVDNPALEERIQALEDRIAILEAGTN